MAYNSCPILLEKQNIKSILISAANKKDN